MLDAERLDVMVRGLDALPTFASTLASLLQRLGTGASQDAGAHQMADVVALVASDPPLAARVLAAAERLHPGGGRTISTAVKLLGVDSLRTMALTNGVLPGSTTQAIDCPALWKHSIAVGVAAEELARRLCEPLDEQEAYSAGLMHDLGRFALLHCMPKSFQKAIETARRRSGSVTDGEREIIGQDHTVVGRRLAERWRLPTYLRDVIWLYRQPFEAIPTSVSAPRMVALITVANALAWEEGLGFFGAGPQRDSESLASRLGLCRKDLSDVASQLPRRVARSGELLGLERQDGLVAYHRAVSDAAAGLAKANEGLRRRVQDLSGWESAFQGLRGFATSLTPESTLVDILECLVDVVAAVSGKTPGSDWPVVAYSLASDDRTVLAVRADGASGPAWRNFTLGDPLPEAPPGSPGEVLAALTGPLDDLGDWIDADSLHHQALSCGGRWIGGAFHPDTGEEDTVVGEAIVGAVALALALVRSRSGTMRVSEQLAGASQVLAATQEALAEAKALAAVGEMAAGAAHELNTPLAVISGRAQLMRARATTEEQRKTWDLIADQAQRISDVFSELMTAVSPAPAVPSVFDAGELLREVGQEFASGRDEAQAVTAQVDIQGEEGRLHCHADRAQIRAALLELMTNAALAGSPGSRIRLAAEMDETRRVVLLTVDDAGVGMDERTALRAFTPFFSVQKAGRRRGMGLPRVRRVVENNGGRVWLRSRAGQGTTVYIELPAGGS
jgi:signal transduction histidine kinase/HD-like signal output (HDOD) protein